MEFESIKKIVETEKQAQIIKEEACKKAKSILEKVEETKENNRVYFKGQLENRINDLKKEQKEANKPRRSRWQEMIKLRAVIKQV